MLMSKSGSLWREWTEDSLVKFVESFLETIRTIEGMLRHTLKVCPSHARSAGENSGQGILLIVIFYININNHNQIDRISYIIGTEKIWLTTSFQVTKTKNVTSSVFKLCQVTVKTFPTVKMR